jgi:hypothetical protein
MELEENPKNPTITKVENIDVKHHFIIRYLDDEIKKKMRRLLLELVNRHEISNFYIEEQQAYQTNRIIYNYHNLITEEENFDIKEIDKRFIKHLH